MTLQNTRPITPEIVAEHGLTPEEYQTVLDIMGREPNMLELGIFSVMWSEHCSYKSSKKWLKTLPTEGPQVIQGPGENAGVVDIGDGQAAIFKIESHNHPSFIEPYQGAATGVGGILRDVFTMGARPVANLNALRFGAPDHPKTRHLVAGVVAGIGGYGNCVGVPTVGGEVSELRPGLQRQHPGQRHDRRHRRETPTASSIRPRTARSAMADMGPVVYVGSKTGRDGIHGATMASAEFGDHDTEEKEDARPVQVGDPHSIHREAADRGLPGADGDRPAPNHSIVLIGETDGWLGNSLYLREIFQGEEGAPPPIDLEAERRNGNLVRSEIQSGAIAALPRSVGWRSPSGSRRDGACGQLRSVDRLFQRPCRPRMVFWRGPSALSLRDRKPGRTADGCCQSECVSGSVGDNRRRHVESYGWDHHISRQLT